MPPLALLVSGHFEARLGVLRGGRYRRVLVRKPRWFCVETKQTCCVKNAETSPIHLVEGLRTVAECATRIAEERTKQEKLRADAQIRVAEIHALRDALMTYLERSFDERWENFRDLFKTLDQAMQKDDAQMAATILNAVVQLAESSPFKALSDVAATKKLLREKGTTWEL